MNHVDRKSSEAFLQRFPALRTGYAIPSMEDDIVAQSSSIFISYVSDKALPYSEIFKDSAADLLTDSLKKSQFADILEPFLIRALRICGGEGAQAIQACIADNIKDTQASHLGRNLFSSLQNHYAQATDWPRLVTEVRFHPPRAPDHEPALPSWAVTSPPLGQVQWSRGYTDIAPRGYGDDLRSPFARMAAAQGVRNETPVIPPNPRAPVPPEVVQAADNFSQGKPQAAEDTAIQLAGNFIRSGDYALLNGFNRVGGILIGIPPQGAHTVDCRSLTWEPDPIVGNRVTLHVSGPHCDWHASSFDRSMLARALAYAADGRSVTVTMTPSSPLLDGLAIHLHPALVDSPIGNDAITIDEFIDTYYRYHDPEREVLYAKLTAPVDEDILLYNEALAIRGQLLQTKLSNRLSNDEQKSL